MPVAQRLCHGSGCARTIAKPAAPSDVATITVELQTASVLAHGFRNAKPITSAADAVNQIAGQMIDRCSWPTATRHNVEVDEAATAA